MRALFLKLLLIITLCSSCPLLLWIFSSPSTFNSLSKAKHSGPDKPDSCKDCKESAFIKKAVADYDPKWRKQEANLKKFRASLNSKCNGVSKAVVTQANTPLGSKITYDGEKRKPLQVSPALFSTFAKVQPFGNKTWDTCAVVGNGGILTNSSCGKMIDSASFVIRCNLPPVENGYVVDVGNKTGLVTANPSILLEKFSGLMERRRPFMESLRPFSASMLLLPAFSYGHNTPLSLRAVYTLEDFGGGPKPIFLNPEYLTCLARYWHAQGLRSMRLSTGLMVTSLALELCNNVHLYGFWPFDRHPFGQQVPLTNHYYDNRQSKKNVHSMPAEFEHLLRLHKQGVLHLHLGKCVPSKT